MSHNPNSKVILEAQGIVKILGEAPNQVKVLKGIDLQLQTGELTLDDGPIGLRQDDAALDPRLHSVANRGPAVASPAIRPQGCRQKVWPICGASTSVLFSRATTWCRR